MPPFDFYQYWINVDDRDVVRLLQLYTFLPLSEISRFRQVQGAELREAKSLLAFEVTKLIHGEAAARNAREAALALFSESGDGAGAPQVVMNSGLFKEGIGIVDLFHAAGLASSKSEARRLIQQGGAYVNRRRIESIEERVGLSDFEEGELLLRAGKKRYQRVVIESD